MKIKLKLPLAFGSALGMLLLAALFGIFMLTQSLDTFTGPVQAGFANERAVKDIENGFKTQVQEWKNTLLRGQEPQQLKKYWGSFQAEERKVADAAVQLQQALPEGEARVLLGRFQQAHVKMGEDYRKGFAAFTEAGFASAVGDKSVQGMDRGPAQLLDEVAQRIAADSAATAVQASKSGQTAIHLSLAVMLGVAVLGLVFGVVLSRAIVRPLNQAVDVAKAVADGDLTMQIKVQGQDETAELLASLQDMQTKLTRIVLGVRHGAESVATASSEIAQGNLDLSGRTEQQASSLQQTSASMEELGASTRQNADSAQQANALAQKASGVAARGGAVMDQVVATMRDISASSAKVGDIISVIDGIAFQTNILALNAAVEAARAGEQGRGFAVVASEVRALAQRSATAAKEIKTLIGSSMERTSHGAQLVGTAGNTIGEIVEAIGRVTAIVAEISTANREQSQSVGQVGEAISQMDRVTQRNAALVEESFAAADSLRGQAQKLVQEVAIFRLQANTGHELMLAA